MVLMVSLSSSISPRTSTVILRDRSPRATAVVTCAMLRTLSVRLPHIAFTESVRPSQVPATPGTIACPPSLPSVPTSRATRVTSDANERSWSTIVLIASFSWRISPRTSAVIFFAMSPLATDVDRDLLREVAAGHGDRHFRDVADLAGEVAGHRVDVVGQVLPRAGHA